MNNKELDMSTAVLSFEALTTLSIMADGKLNQDNHEIFVAHLNRFVNDCRSSGISANEFAIGIANTLVEMLGEKIVEILNTPIVSDLFRESVEHCKKQASEM